MGLTDHNARHLARLIPERQIQTIMELGSQQAYISEEWNGQYASEWYWKHNISKYHSIDRNGENGAMRLDLAKPIEEQLDIDQEAFFPQYDLVTDFGTSEHVKNYYICWLNKFNLCKVGGIIYSENPATGNWPGHGKHYITDEFYHDLAQIAPIEVIETGLHPAMQNTTDGWNVWGIIQKTGKEFPSAYKFKKLAIFTQ